VLSVALGGYAAWRRFQNRDPLANLPPAVYQPASQSAETLPLPPPPKR
jgi:hypothetical protein